MTPGLRKVLFATALGTVALALAAHQLKRRRRKKKQVGPEMGGEQLGTVPMPILMARKVPSVKKGRYVVAGLCHLSHFSAAFAVGLRLVPSHLIARLPSVELRAEQTLGSGVVCGVGPRCLLYYGEFPCAQE